MLGLFGMAKVSLYQIIILTAVTLTDDLNSERVGAGGRAVMASASRERSLIPRAGGGEGGRKRP